MSRRIFVEDQEQLRWENIDRDATAEDRTLASFLMRMAFHNNPDREHNVGLGPVYLTQAYYINRYSKDELRNLL